MSEREPFGQPRAMGSDYGSTAAPPAVTFSETSAAEVDALSDSIANSITDVTTRLRGLERMMNQLGGPNDSVALREKIHASQHAVNEAVSGAARGLPRLAAAARGGGRPRRLQVERLTQALQDALAYYTTVQKNVTEKMSAHAPRPARGRPDEEMMQQEEHDEAALIANQQAQMRQTQFDTSMLLEREAALSRVEADVLDVGHIMQELAAMVQAQGSVVDTVESHIEAAGASVEAGADQLAKAAEHQRSYRRKMFILILIALVVGVVFVVWIVKAFR